MLAGDGDTGLAQFLAGGRAAGGMEALRRERWLSVKTSLQRPRWSRPSFICRLQPSRQQGVKTAGRGSEEDGMLKRATDGPADAGGGGALPADDTHRPGAGGGLNERPRARGQADDIQPSAREVVKRKSAPRDVPLCFCVTPDGYGGGASGSSVRTRLLRRRDPVSTCAHGYCGGATEQCRNAVSEERWYQARAPGATWFSRRSCCLRDSARLTIEGTTRYSV